ncbi:Asp-tRNA(Asn)/Glu-tRNA(Gln) amidotransferase subunit GatA [Marinospirillum alkaliphilum]|uniref:Glutamyl-tRNA(Gln) amidotransferase subunit A n=1 Tax=Marinospirillum alkaliphilum DSM 21637 TaxID=1122209 RepID=A0A1K1YWP8_9GAMM|nr:Asp-tRNA(Asn)/Glu-tRNA(Gln) amidotransferase subunit GatA [Marinospirillum alkaliphilum]SFX66296.1 aspartyl/glutamyl-tRNA(Asn/Gln) amidotransferase subunit A [Marinospirillum alkaliphilum DSM 21637]
MHDLSLTQMAKGLTDRKFSSVELTQTFLERIRKLDPQLNSFITVTETEALETAKQADRRLAEEKHSPLTGIPLAHKDLFCTEGVKTTCGSRILDNFVAPYNATVVEKLAQAGAVSLGKTNLDEFAMGSSNESSFYGAVKNPWNLDAVPGGSSGGSAAAVAARLVPAATGTDTGGSIRQPAAFCGITGIKPTYGRVSRWGMVAYASSLDQGGPMARSAEDCALLLQHMAGFDPRDSTSIQRAVPDYLSLLDEPLQGLTLGLPKEYFGADLNPQMAERLQAAIAELEKLGASVKEVSLPLTRLAIPAYYVIAPAEASSNLSRFDGVRYGHRCADPKDLEDLYKRSRSEGFGEEVKRRILVGTYALSEGFYDAYYRKAQQLRRLITQDFQKAFNEVDLLLAPTTPTPAWDLGSKTSDPVQMYLEDIYTLGVNLAGLPAISVPAGLVGGRPVGMQLIGNHFDEGRLLNVAHQFQQVTDFHLKAPELN